MTRKSICVLGLGYIGLPTAAMFATHGVEVTGVDVNPRVLDVLKRGDIHIDEVGLRALVREAMASGKLTVSGSPVRADVFIVAVPTPFNADKTADMRAVTSAVESMVPFLSKGNLVILESTSPPGTTDKLVRPILERSGLKAGADFLLAYSPERVLPGQILKELAENARIIGGIDSASARAGRDLYAIFVTGEIKLTDATTAEMVKLMENTYRDVNIALANEFALIAEKIGVDAWEAIQLANCHPRVKILRPGPGVGGHCIAIDPWFLVEAAPEEARLIRQARLVNDSMPDHVVEIVSRIVRLELHPTVACLGLTYKADVDDTRESPAVEIVSLLAARGARTRVYDPHVSSWSGDGVYLAESVEDAVRGSELTLVLVDHAQFRALSPADLDGASGRTVLDTRACVDAAVLERAGCRVVRLGAAS